LSGSTAFNFERTVHDHTTLRADLGPTELLLASLDHADLHSRQLSFELL
jgi:hypothetical protein